MNIHNFGLLVLIVFLTVLSVVGRSSADLCGRARHLVNYTRVDMAMGGFCSDSGPSCCHGWEGLVQPGIELLFEKNTFSQFSALATLLNDIKLFLKDLHCPRDIEDGTLRKDVTSALSVLQEIDWTNLVNMTMSSGSCRLALTRLIFCSSHYCLVNNESNVIGEGRFCRSDCMTTVRHCVFEPFELINGDWKQAISSVSTSLRILAARSQCPEQKPQFDNFVVKLNEWRDPASRTISSCANGHSECPLSQRSEFHNVSGDKSLLLSLSSRLQSVASNLGRYWSSVPEDTIQSSGSGSHDPDDNLPTDDEDLLPFDDHGGSGSGGYDPNNPDSQFPTTSSTTTTTTSRPRLASHGSSSLGRASNSQLLLLYITPLISLFLGSSSFSSFSINFHYRLLT